MVKNNVGLVIKSSERSELSYMTLILGGLALFLYGQFLLERSIQNTSRAYLRAFIKLLTKHKITAIFIGALLTVGMQSSTISVITLLDLINLGLLQLRQAIGLLLGTSVGTTIILQVISFDLKGFALWLVIAGFLVSKLTKNMRGELLIGFGFMFYGIYLMSGGVSIFKETSFGNYFLGGVCVNPFHYMIGAFILTVITQSSLAAMAVGITLMRSGGIGLDCIIPIIFGAHIGAGILPLFYSWKVKGAAIGRQLAIANLIYRILGVLIFIPLIGALAKISLVITLWFGASPSRQLANAHTIFTLAVAALFIPLIMPYTRLIRKIMPDLKTKKKVTKDITIIMQEEKKLKDEISKILNESIKLWEEDRLTIIDKIEKQYLGVRLLKEDITKDLTSHVKDSLKDRQYIKILGTANNLERIGNIVGSSLTALARKRAAKGLIFSMEGLNEVLQINRSIIDEFNASAKILEGEKITTGLKTFDEKVNLLISESFSSHINRMRKGFRETKETSSLHAEAINLLEQMHWLVRKLVA